MQKSASKQSINRSSLSSSLNISNISGIFSSTPFSEKITIALNYYPATQNNSTIDTNFQEALEFQKKNLSWQTAFYRDTPNKKLVILENMEVEYKHEMKNTLDNAIRENLYYYDLTNIFNFQKRDIEPVEDDSIYGRKFFIGNVNLCLGNIYTGKNATTPYFDEYLGSWEDFDKNSYYISEEEEKNFLPSFYKKKTYKGMIFEKNILGVFIQDIYNIENNMMKFADNLEVRLVFKKNKISIKNFFTCNRCVNIIHFFKSFLQCASYKKAFIDVLEIISKKPSCIKLEDTLKRIVFLTVKLTYKEKKNEAQLKNETSEELYSKIMSFLSTKSKDQYQEIIKRSTEKIIADKRLLRFIINFYVFNIGFLTGNTIVFVVKNNISYIGVYQEGKDQRGREVTVPIYNTEYSKWYSNIECIKKIHST